VPAPTRAQLVDGLERGSASYAALGVGTIREAVINLDELAAYQDAAEQGRLSVRVRPLIRVGNELTAEQAIALIEGLGVRSGFGDDWLRIWDLKFVMDGGVEGCALEQPYANDPANSGHLNWDPAVMTRVCAAAVRRSWRIGTHAVGDRALRVLLDVYEAVAAFFALEAVARKSGEASELAATEADQATTKLIVASYGLAAALSLVLRRLPAGRLPPMSGPAGVGAVAAGLALRAWSMRTLGGHYSRTLRTTPGQVVVDQGPYRLIRHPGYLGSIVVWTGFGVASGSAPAALAVVTLMSAAYRQLTAAASRQRKKC